MPFRTLRFRKVESPAQVLTAGGCDPAWWESADPHPVRAPLGSARDGPVMPLDAPLLSSCFFAHECGDGEGSPAGGRPPPGAPPCLSTARSPGVQGGPPRALSLPEPSVRGTQNGLSITLLKSCYRDEFSHLSGEAAKPGFCSEDS